MVLETAVLMEMVLIPAVLPEMLLVMAVLLEKEPLQVKRQPLIYKQSPPSLFLLSLRPLFSISLEIIFLKNGREDRRHLPRSSTLLINLEEFGSKSASQHLKRTCLGNYFRT